MKIFESLLSDDALDMKIRSIQKNLKNEFCISDVLCETNIQKIIIDQSKLSDSF